MSMNEKRLIGVIVILHLVGIAGIWSPYRADFVLLTPINLIVCLGLVLWNKKASWSFIGLAYLLGFIVEVIGVNTGLLFGEYQYGQTLGLKVWETPLMIGVNWVMVTLTAGYVVNQFLQTTPEWLKIFLGSIFMVFLDFLIEPMAPKLDFWVWKDDIIPFQNYLAWWITSLVMMFLFFKIEKGTRNKVGVALFFVQVSFFLILNLIL
jgi:bisanhydrobacterioruberin hydratase